MRLSTKIIGAVALAVLLVPAFSLFASEAAKPLVNTPNAENSSSAAASDSLLLPEAPMPIASMQAAMPYAGGRNTYTPRIEWFMGYTYLRAVPELANGNRMVSLNGGSTSVAFNFNRFFGIVGDFGGFNDTRLLLTGAGPSVNAQVDQGTAFTFLGGPRLSYRKYDRVTPFVQVLAGGIHASEITLSGCTGACTLLPSANAFALTAGGGVDVRIHHRLALRLIQAEYMMTRFDNLSTGSSASQNDIRLSTGLVLRFGGAHRLPPLPPLSYSCSVTPTSAFVGEPIAVSGTAISLDPAKTAVYTWTVDGGTVTGTSSTGSIDTSTAAPGSYTLKGHVSEGDKPSENADCTAPYIVKAFEPPTVSCAANPSTVNSGDPSTITATGVSPQNRMLTYSYNSTAGSVSGTGTMATLTTGGVPAGVITVTCNVADDKGHTATASTPVTVVVHLAALPTVSELCPISFARDVRRPARVNNEGKACLDQVAQNLQSNADEKLALIGSAASGEKHGIKLAAERAVNTKEYLVKEKGIDASRITLYTSAQDGKQVTTTVIPAGANFDATGDTPVQ